MNQEMPAPDPEDHPGSLTDKNAIRHFMDLENGDADKVWWGHLTADATGVGIEPANLAERRGERLVENPFLHQVRELMGQNREPYLQRVDRLKELDVNEEISAEDLSDDPEKGVTAYLYWGAHLKDFDEQLFRENITVSQKVFIDAVKPLLEVLLDKPEAYLRYADLAKTLYPAEFEGQGSFSFSKQSGLITRLGDKVSRDREEPEQFLEECRMLAHIYPEEMYKILLKPGEWRNITAYVESLPAQSFDRASAAAAAQLVRPQVEPRLKYHFKNWEQLMAGLKLELKRSGDFDQLLRRNRLVKYLDVSLGT